MSFVRAHLGAWLDHHRWPPGQARDDIVLVVNELVTHAIEHTYSPHRLGPSTSPPLCCPQAQA